MAFYLTYNHECDVFQVFFGNITARAMKGKGTEL